MNKLFNYMVDMLFKSYDYIYSTFVDQMKSHDVIPIILAMKNETEANRIIIL